MKIKIINFNYQHLLRTKAYVYVLEHLLCTKIKNKFITRKEQQRFLIFYLNKQTKKKKNGYIYV